MSTPGPWVRAIYHSPAGESFDVFAPSGTLICNVAHESNSRLIAAAPDLLEALVAIREAFRGGQGMFPAQDLAEKAIAKAEGR